jgi:small subunit ribosomal protein S16
MYFRIVAIDSRQPRDGRVIEELGSYDPMVKNTDDRVRLVPDRIKYWMSVGALPSERCSTLFKKYMAKFEQLQAEQAAPLAQAGSGQSSLPMPKASYAPPPPAPAAAPAEGGEPAPAAE